MLGKERILGLIPARGGSKGIKDKNIKELNGKPLIAYTIEAAKGSKYIDCIMVSTDSEKIACISREFGAWVPSLRPDELAEDTSRTIDVVIYTKKMLEGMGKEFGILCLLQPTSPLRDSADIDRAIEIYYNSNCTSVVAVSEVREHPLLIRTIDSKGRLETLLNMNSTVRRQDMPKYYRVNGSIYVNATDEINENTSFNDNVLACVIDAKHGVDIDAIEDFMLAECIIKNGKPE